MKIPRYEMILWWSGEDGAFVVVVPELPGCMAHGATRTAAIENGESAIAFWLKTAKADGSSHPAAQGLSDGGVTTPPQCGCARFHRPNHLRSRQTDGDLSRA